MESQTILRIQEDIGYLEKIEERVSLETLSLRIDEAFSKLQREIIQQCVQVKTELLSKLKDNPEFNGFLRNLKNLKALARTVQESYVNAKELGEEIQERNLCLHDLLKSQIYEPKFEKSAVVFEIKQPPSLHSFIKSLTSLDLHLNGIVMSVKKVEDRNPFRVKPKFEDLDIKNPWKMRPFAQSQ